MLSAAIAFYTILSLSPLLVIVIAIAGRVFGPDAVRGQIVEEFGSLIGHGPAVQIETMIAQASQPQSNLVASILGIATLLFGAMGVFGQLKDALDTVWGTSPVKRRGLWRFVRSYVLSLAMVLAVSFILLVSLVVSAGLSAFAEWAGGLVPTATMAWIRLLDFGVSLLVITMLFATIYRILPDVRISWRDVWIGAAATSLLFNLGKSLIGLYLGTASVGSVFGAAGSVVIILVWVYYSASVFLLGAEFTEIFARRWGSRSGHDASSVESTH
jgi:membrane protein